MADSDEKWRFRLYGHNLTSARIVQQLNATATGDQVTYERPIEVGVGAEYHF